MVLAKRYLGFLSEGVALLSIDQSSAGNDSVHAKELSLGWLDHCNAGDHLHRFQIVS